jgi:hypothetical protein
MVQDGSSRWTLANGYEARGGRMRALLFGHRWPGTGTLFILMAIATALLGGCVVYEPVPGPAYYGSSYDRVWDSALGAAGDAGVRITSADRTTGIIRGVASSIDVTISVITQADGRIRVEFSSKAPKGPDTDLNERFTRAYNRRMGR